MKVQRAQRHCDTSDDGEMASKIDAHDDFWGDSVDIADTTKTSRGRGRCARGRARRQDRRLHTLLLSFAYACTHVVRTHAHVPRRLTHCRVRASCPVFPVMRACQKCMHFRSKTLRRSGKAKGPDPCAAPKAFQQCVETLQRWTPANPSSASGSLVSGLLPRSRAAGRRVSTRTLPVLPERAILGISYTGRGPGAGIIMHDLGL